MISTRFVLCGLAALVFTIPSVGSSAAWQWRDAQGRMVYSDRPPPHTIRASQIIRSPAAEAPRETHLPMASESTDNGVASSDPVSGATDRAAPPWVERARAARAAAAEREKTEAGQREENERIARNERACEDMHTAIRTLESGLRVVSLNAQGESIPLDDAERARRLERTRAELARDCTGH